MNPGAFASASFCQIARVVKDIAAAESFFTGTMGVEKFLHFDNRAAEDTEARVGYSDNRPRSASSTRLWVPPKRGTSFDGT